jgi:hypothetical protein
MELLNNIEPDQLGTVKKNKFSICPCETVLLWLCTVFLRSYEKDICERTMYERRNKTTGFRSSEARRTEKMLRQYPCA